MKMLKDKAKRSGQPVKKTVLKEQGKKIFEWMDKVLRLHDRPTEKVRRRGEGGSHYYYYYYYYY